MYKKDELVNLTRGFELKCSNRIINTIITNLGRDEKLLYGVKGALEKDWAKSFVFCTNKRIIMIKDILINSAFVQIPLNKIVGAGVGSFLGIFHKIVISNANGNQIIIQYMTKNQAVSFIRVVNEAISKGEAIFVE